MRKLLSRRQILAAAAVAASSRWPLKAAAPSLVFARGDSPMEIDPAYLSNGFVGIRPGGIPLLPFPTYVTGFVQVHPDFQVESLSPAPCPLATDIRVRGVTVMKPLTTKLLSQRLDTSNGELTSEFLCPIDEGQISVKVCQFASRSQPSLLWQKLEIQTTAPVAVQLLPAVAFDGVPGQVSKNVFRADGNVDQAVLFEASGGLSKLGIAVRVLPDRRFGRNTELAGYLAELAAGEKYIFHTLATMVADFYHTEPDLEAVRLVNWALQSGVDRIREDNRQAWRELWKSRVTIVGDSQDQKALDAAFFYLHSSLHPANLNGMAPYGLSSSSHYLGHSFWDTETWSLLPILLTSPETAESLLRFRLRGLAAAKRRAGLFGYRGAQFPWEAAPSNGEEVTPLFAATGWAEQHVVPDVALAFWQYQLAAGDEFFMKEATWPILRAVAEWIASRGVMTQRGYEIRNIMGPDESKNGLDNNSYVNLACRLAMKAALRCAEMNRFPVPANWKAIASRMYLPVGSEGVLAIAEGSHEPAIGDMSILLPFDLDLDGAVIRTTWNAGRQSVEGSGQIGFARAATAALAANMGDRKSAARLFRLSWQPFWLEPYGMIREAASQTYGCFLTDFGAILQAAMFGFTGIRIGESDWAKYDSTLPENWKSIEIERIYVRGEPKRLFAKHGARAILS